jgi:NAD(P)-dependent dehydrogenase (short-subunit alcohol dehydrogenase family)
VQESNNMGQAPTMQGKVVLVTGASSGLGAHFAKVLAAAGAAVAVGARRVEKLDTLVEQIKAAGGTALAVALDVTDTASVSDALNAIESGLGPVTVLVNNAGVADSRRFINVDEASWDYVMDTNLKGAWRVAQTVAKRILELGLTGSVINISSILGLRVGLGESTYASSKAALVHLTRSMALELGHKGVRVNAICPGYFKTEMNRDYFDSPAGKAFVDNTPARRLGNLDELNGPLLLLATEAGSFINGIALPVDGGHLVSSL